MKHAAQNSSIRRALLAKIHIAKKDMGLDDELYRLILEEEFPTRWGSRERPSAGDLSNRDLERLVDRFQAKGWKPQSAKRIAHSENKNTKSQPDALKEKIGQMVLHTDFDEVRLRGLVRKICGVDKLQWCGDAVRLKKLLAVIGSMMDRGDIKVFPPAAEKP